MACFDGTPESLLVRGSLHNLLMSKNCDAFQRMEIAYSFVATSLLLSLLTCR